jgi:hypothetical protein
VSCQVIAWRCPPKHRRVAGAQLRQHATRLSTCASATWQAVAANAMERNVSDSNDHSVQNSVASSAGVHSSGRSLGFRWLNQRSRQALPVRPGSAQEIADQALHPCTATAFSSASSSSFVQPITAVICSRGGIAAHTRSSTARSSTPRSEFRGSRSSDTAGTEFRIVSKRKQPVMQDSGSSQHRLNTHQSQSESLSRTVSLSQLQSRQRREVLASCSSRMWQPSSRSCAIECWSPQCGRDGDCSLYKSSSGRSPPQERATGRWNFPGGALIPTKLMISAFDSWSAVKFDTRSFCHSAMSERERGLHS